MLLPLLELNRPLSEKRYILDHSSHVVQFDELCESENNTEGAWVSRAWLKGDCLSDKPITL